MQGNFSLSLSLQAWAYILHAQIPVDATCSLEFARRKIPLTSSVWLSIRPPDPPPQLGPPFIIDRTSPAPSTRVKPHPHWYQLLQRKLMDEESFQSGPIVYYSDVWIHQFKVRKCGPLSPSTFGSFFFLIYCKILNTPIEHCPTPFWGLTV